MGLGTSHNCWHGSYISFMYWRDTISRVAGLGPINHFIGFGGAKEWPENEPLVKLLYHSDCDGQLEVEDLLPIANRLQTLVDETSKMGEFVAGTYEEDVVEKTVIFIKGLRLAASLGEPVDFH